MRETRRRWNEEWGDLDTEGNLWWTGSRKQGWIDVMGTNPLGWICESQNLFNLSIFSFLRVVSCRRPRCGTLFLFVGHRVTGVPVDVSLVQ